MELNNHVLKIDSSDLIIETPLIGRYCLMLKTGIILSKWIIQKRKGQCLFHPSSQVHVRRHALRTLEGHLQ